MKKITSIIAGIAMIAGLASCTNSGTSNEKETSVQDSTTATEVIEFSEQDTIVVADVDQPTIIDFNATWCGPCQAFKPNFEKAAKEYAGKVDFISIDVDINPGLAQAFGISSIPAIVYIKPGEEPQMQVGFMSYEEFKPTIDEFLK